MYQRLLLSLITPIAFAACGVGTLTGGEVDDMGGGGGGGGGGGDDVSAADAAPNVEEYSLTMTPSLSEINLGGQTDFTATITSENYAGPVTLDLAGAMADWEVTYSPAQSLTLAENESVDVIISVNVPTNGTAGAGALALSLDGELGTRTGNATMTVLDQVRVAVQAGSGNGPHAGFTGSFKIKTGTAVVFVNEDNTLHHMHSDPHGTEIDVGESETLYYNFVGTIQTYCHEHGKAAGTFNLIVE